MNDDVFEQLLTELLAAPEREPLSDNDYRDEQAPDMEGYEVDASGRFIG